MHFSIPIVHKEGRGVPFTYDLGYDSSVWYPSGGTWAHDPNWGWRGVTEAAAGLVTNTKTGPQNCGTGGTGYFFSSWVYHDRLGTAHAFPGIRVTSCPDGTDELIKAASDGSGYVIDAVAGGQSDYGSATVWAVGGETIIPPVRGNSTQTGTVYDRNGNYFSTALNSGTTTFTDTLGTNILKVSGTNPVQYQFLNPAAAWAKLGENSLKGLGRWVGRVRRL